jgi:hypothetical protein
VSIMGHILDWWKREVIAPKPVVPRPLHEEVSVLMAASPIQRFR